MALFLGILDAIVPGGNGLAVSVQLLDKQIEYQEEVRWCIQLYGVLAVTLHGAA